VEYEYDGHTYQLTKLGLSDAKETLAELQKMEFFENALTSLTTNPDAVDRLERKLFRQNAQWLNETGQWVPLSKELTEAHFSGRLLSYYSVLIKAIGYNFEDFLSDGGTTDPAAETSPE